MVAKRLLAVAEIVGLLVGALVAGGLLKRLAGDGAITDPVQPLVFVWLPLLALAWTADRFIRGRGPGEWGMQAPGPWPERLRMTARLLFLGGAIPLALSLALPRTPVADLDPLIVVASLAPPLIGQEVYALGFGHRRMSDAFGPVGTAVMMVALIVLAHANHLGAGPAGWLFLVAIAWQALLWSACRSAGFGILPLLAAHFLLLLCYLEPTWGLPAALIAGLIGLPGARPWLDALRAPFGRGPETAAA
jgi:hypothetical protein